MSELKQSIAQLLINNFKGATRKKASDMAIAIMAFVNADRDRSAGYCAPSSTGECSCRKFADDPTKCENRRVQPEANADAKDTRRTGTLYVAIQRAAAELPEGWTISLEVERDAGTVELIDPEGERKLIDGNDGYLCQAVDAAIDAARQAKEKGNG